VESTVSRTRAVLAGFLVAALVLVACWRVAQTYGVFSQTWDEPAHLAAGMEWLERESYQYDPLHPPLARVLAALGPYVTGHRGHGFANAWLEGNAILNDGGRYWETLTLARAGILPFLITAALVVYFWTTRLYGRPTGIAAVALLTTLPSILGHSGLATTDMALAATLPLALLAAWAWLQRPTRWASAALGAAVGLAVLSKLSALLFLPVGFIALLACHLLLHRAERHAAPSRLIPIRIVYLTALILIWVGYGCSVGPLATSADVPVEQRGEAVAQGGYLYRRAHRIAELPIYPAAELFQGLAVLRLKNQSGQKGYLLGEVRSSGWWYYYPVALGVKAPIAFLMLCFIGVAVLRSEGKPRRWELAVPALAAGLVLLAAMPSRINIGSRHILPVFVLMSVPAAGGLKALWSYRRLGWTGPAIASLLLAWQLAVSIEAHPDYIAYFNELASGRSTPVLVDSDLDNGQDLGRLADTLRQLRPSPLWIAYAGSADLTKHGLPAFRLLPPREPVTGWIAISLYDLKLGPVDAPTHDDYAWLEACEPRATVGKSILLYFVDSNGACGKPRQRASADGTDPDDGLAEWEGQRVFDPKERHHSVEPAELTEGDPFGSSQTRVHPPAPGADQIEVEDAVDPAPCLFQHPRQQGFAVAPHVPQLSIERPVQYGERRHEDDHPTPLADQ
jgi:hypothetical protein